MKTTMMSGKRPNSDRRTFQKRLRVDAKEMTASAATADFESSRLCTDVSSALEYLKNLFNCEKFDGCLPPIVLKHQLYSILPSRTAVDKKLGEMRENCQIRLFKFGSEANVFMIVATSDYKSHVLKHCKELSPVLIERTLSLISTCPDIYVSKQRFSDLQFDAKEIPELVKAGVLTIRDVGSWWVAVPGAGLFVKSFLAGRKYLLNAIKKSKMQQVLQQDLLQRPLPKAVKLGSVYHLHDLIGADLVEGTETTSGLLLRIRK